MMRLFIKSAAYAGAFTAFVAAGGAVWAGADYLGIRPTLIREHRVLQMEVAATTKELRIRRFQELDAKKRSTVGLTSTEFEEWCDIGQTIGWLKECRS